jgi:hypothetical protein
MVNPGAAEICDGVDNNCNGEIDEGVTTTFYADQDGDGFGDPDEILASCEAPDNYTAAGTDCDDESAESYPGGSEICDGLDNDCDGVIDGADAPDATTWYRDSDGDGFGDTDKTATECEQPAGYSAQAGDCDDTDTRFNPGAKENDCTDPNDYNCDGSTGYADEDGDGFAACEECNDYIPEINPDAEEVCDEADNDCDGDIDEDDAADALTWYIDYDGDGYGVSDFSTLSCSQPTGYVDNTDDCDDTEASANPGESEVCDEIDNDCDGDIDEGVTETYYFDYDGDSYGDPDRSTEACAEPSGYVSDSSDCDDADSTSYPGAEEVCDEVDNDCDGDVDNDATDGAWFYTDDDGDSFGAPGSETWGCDGISNELDCDDANGTEPMVADATVTGGSGTYGDPFGSIQDAIDSAESCVVAFAGTYAEAIDFSGKDISVTGAEGSGATFLDGSGLGTSIVTASSGEGDAELIGVTLSGGEGTLELTSSTYSCGSSCTGYYYYSTYCGGAIYAESSSLTLEDVVITDNILQENDTTTSKYDYYYTYSFGGGICASNATMNLTDVAITDNYAYDGGGMYIYNNSVVTVEQSWLLGNMAYDGGAVELESGTLSYTNVISGFNEAESSGGGIMNAGGSVSLTNATLRDDAAYGVLYADSSATLTLDSSIVYALSSYGVFISSGTYTGQYSDVYSDSGTKYSYYGMTDPTGTDGNISDDPMLVDVSDDGDFTNDDWSVESKSSAVDAGNPDKSMNDPDGTTNDMGAYGGPYGAW